MPLWCRIPSIHESSVPYSKPNAPPHTVSIVRNKVALQANEGESTSLNFTNSPRGDVDVKTEPLLRQILIEQTVILHSGPDCNSCI
ncbi:Uncharacterized protein HZ326_14282 [Fusarium oxysporum f. sp. albedinis]|nr:Uncharacterized protein HZ326_14282 [Fusarium oxysporum f. sp. albedinis]